MAVVDQQLADTATAPRNAPVLELRLWPAIDLSREQFVQLCQLNRDVRIERNAEGSIALMPPTGGETGARSGRLFAAVFGWADEDGTGVARRQRRGSPPRFRAESRSHLGVGILSVS